MPLDRAPGVAVVGAGFIGPVHVEGLRRLGIPVNGILGLDARRGRAAAARSGSRAPTRRSTTCSPTPTSTRAPRVAEPSALRR